MRGGTTPTTAARTCASWVRGSRRPTRRRNEWMRGTARSRRRSAARRSPVCTRARSGRRPTIAGSISASRMERWRILRCRVRPTQQRATSTPSRQPTARCTCRCGRVRLWWTARRSERTRCGRRTPRARTTCSSATGTIRMRRGPTLRPTSTWPSVRKPTLSTARRAFNSSRRYCSRVRPPPRVRRWRRWACTGGWRST